MLQRIVFCDYNRVIILISSVLELCVAMSLWLSSRSYTWLYTGKFLQYYACRNYRIPTTKNIFGIEYISILTPIIASMFMLSEGKIAVFDFWNVLD